MSSGAECAAALRQAGFDVTEIDAGQDLPARLQAAAPDVVFNALHGRFGEDGCVQGMLDWLGIPYTHSGVLASAIAMDKTLSKQLFRDAGLPVADSVIVPTDQARREHPISPPYVVKPNDEGSSVGVYLVREGANGPADIGAQMPDKVMVETYIPGRELTTLVLGERALGVTEIVSDDWYDYDAKYKAGGSRHVVPAEIPADITAACQDYALRAHRVLGCAGMSRSDFRWDDTRGLAGLYLLETNTQPGMTPTSLAPEQAAILADMDFPALCAWLIEDALCRA
ncbi:D-alanine-D-alanine ligase [Paracoccus isoporae]|uniref:D-alanine--D-alanine ligase n=2 Tax=Paracoccus isoporae TaxID=591205 RepID=A0A1G7AVY4_9RHOB|nr:D-alanine-D-alanine ligase [Paracoccus isoporae]